MRFILILLMVLLFANLCNADNYSIVNISNKGWVLLDESNTPFIIKGVCYSPVPIGKMPYNYNIFTDRNRHWFIDGDYMENMGVNTVRIYSGGNDIEACKKFIRQMYKLYSINTVFPLPMDMQGVDYSSKKAMEVVKNKILNTVKEYKDTPGILLWLVGNEIDYYFYDDRAYWETEDMEELSSPYKRAVRRAEIIFKFVNEIMAEIQDIDVKHPVGVSLGKTEFFNLIEDNLANTDFVGLNSYQGRNFSSVWSYTKKIKMPVLITEFGYDAFNTKENKEDENSQSKFIISLWNDIYKNTFHKNKKAICLGGMIFEWTDEWWKYNYGDPRIHETNGTWPNAAWLDFTSKKPNNVQEEWFGIFKIKKSIYNSINDRIPRKAYFKLQELWNPD